MEELKKCSLARTLFYEIIEVNLNPVTSNNSLSVTLIHGMADHSKKLRLRIKYNQALKTIKRDVSSNSFNSSTKSLEGLSIIR